MPLMPTCTDGRAHSHTPSPDASQISGSAITRRARIGVEHQRRQHAERQRVRHQVLERGMRERRREDADQAVHVARTDAEIVDVPAEQPGAEPRQPDAGDQAGCAEQRVTHTRAVALNGGGAGFGSDRCDIHQRLLGAGCRGARVPDEFLMARLKVVANPRSGSRRPTIRVQCMPYHGGMKDQHASANPVVHLKIERRSNHPWIFQKMVEKPEPRPKPGSIVDIIDRDGTFAGRGFYNGHSRIALRVLTANPDEAVDEAFFARKIAQAVQLRREVLKLDAVTDAYRLVHSEGDGLSGLVVDRFADTLVIEYFSAGMFKQRDLIKRCLLEHFPDAKHLRVRRGARAEAGKLRPRASARAGAGR